MFDERDEFVPFGERRGPGEGGGCLPIAAETPIGISQMSNELSHVGFLCDGGLQKLKAVLGFPVLYLGPTEAVANVRIVRRKMDCPGQQIDREIEILLLFDPASA